MYVRVSAAARTPALPHTTRDVCTSASPCPVGSKGQRGRTREGEERGSRARQTMGDLLIIRSTSVLTTCACGPTRERGCFVGGCAQACVCERVDKSVETSVSVRGTAGHVRDMYPAAHTFASHCVRARTWQRCVDIWSLLAEGRTIGARSLLHAETPSRSLRALAAWRFSSNCACIPGTMSASTWKMTDLPATLQ